MMRTVFFDLLAGVNLGLFAYTAWIGEYVALPLFGVVAWFAVKLWIEEQENNNA